MPIQNRKIYVFHVVIPACNAEKYIARSIESVLQQSIVSNEKSAIREQFQIKLHLHVVINNSQDRTEEIARQKISALVSLEDKSAHKSVHKSAHISVHITCDNTPKNAGMARNVALREIYREIEQDQQQNYIAFLDVDDFWRTTWLEAVIERIEKDSIGQNAGLIYGYKDEESAGNIQQRAGYACDGDGFTALLFRNFLTTSAVVIKANTPRLFNEEYDFAEDWNLWLQIAEKEPIACVPSAHVVYQKLIQSASRQKEKLFYYRHTEEKIIKEWRNHPKINQDIWEKTMAQLYIGSAVRFAQFFLAAESDIELSVSVIYGALERPEQRKKLLAIWGFNRLPTIVRQAALTKTQHISKLW